MRLKISGGRLVDPANGIDRVQDLYVSGSSVAALGSAPPGFVPDRELDVRGCIVCPGLIDLGARLREPGQEHKATIASELRAAARSGITTLCCPPDTDPVIDTPAVVELIQQRAAQSGLARVEVQGALTAGLAGEQLAEMGALGQAGCVAVSNAMASVRDTEVLRRAMEYAATFGLTVFLQPEDPWLARDARVHHGAVGTRLGLGGIPETAETIEVARALLLVEQTTVRAHFCRLSTGRGVEMVAEAQGRGLRVSADVAAHQLHLSEADVNGFDSRCHVRPPLRTAADRERLRAALAQGVVGAVCSDHQPHERDAKLNPFPTTEPGISALETLLPLALELADLGVLTLPETIARLTSGPARVLGLPRGSLAVGAPADICIFNPQARWTLTEETMVSRGHNTPFLGRELKGQVTHTLLGGRLVHELAA